MLLGLLQTLASPLSGILGDRYDRVLVLSSGAFIWGIMTSAMALTVTLHQARHHGSSSASSAPCSLQQSPALQMLYNKGNADRVHDFVACTELPTPAEGGDRCL